MFMNLKSVAAAMAVLITPGAAMAQSWTDWGEAEGRVLIEAENGVVTEVAREGDGSLRVYGTVDDWLRLMLVGSDCTGEGSKQRCKGLGFNALFEVDDEARSMRLEHEFDYQYVADVADEGDLILHRQVELAGGATLTNIRAQLNGFIVTSELAADRIWPTKPDDAEPAKDR